MRSYKVFTTHGIEEEQRLRVTSEANVELRTI
jgi:hypothetical protein